MTTPEKRSDTVLVALHSHWLGDRGCLPHVQIHQGGQPIQGDPWGQGDHVHHLIQKDLVCRVHPKEEERE